MTIEMYTLMGWRKNVLL